MGSVPAADWAGQEGWVGAAAPQGKQAVVVAVVVGMGVAAAAAAAGRAVAGGEKGMGVGALGKAVAGVARGTPQ